MEIAFIIIIVIAFLLMSNKKTNNNYEENKRNGEEYERKVGKYYEEKGYIVDYNGLKKGLNDGGIDLICKNENVKLKYVVPNNQILHNSAMQIFRNRYYKCRYEIV